MTLVTGSTLEHLIGRCDTGLARGLSLQIIDVMNSMSPGILVPFSDLDVDAGGNQINPFLQAAARSGLVQAIKRGGRTMVINSAYRTVAQQFLLFEQHRRGICDIRAAASPGRSNHESGLALDIEDPDGWEPFLEAHGWRRLGSFDPPHFDFMGGGVNRDLGRTALKAFQRLWNLHNPGDPLVEDGLFGNETARRLRGSPAEGFAASRAVLRSGVAGGESDDVRNLQEKLRAAGVEVEATGLFDAATDQAVRTFQSRHGLKVDGIAGPATMGLLDSLGAERAPVVVRSGGGSRVAALEGIDVSRLSEEERHAFDILSRLPLEHLRELKKKLGLTRPDVVGPTTVAEFARFCASRGVDLTKAGVSAFKARHRLGNSGSLEGVIGPQTASVYYEELMRPAAARPRGGRSINAAGLALVKEFEGLHDRMPDGRIKAYIDPVGIPTIGYGHTAGVFMGQIITQADAERLLVEDLSDAAEAVAERVSVDVHENQFGALVSFVFNVGEGAFASSTLLRKLNAGDHAEAARQLLRWTKGEVNGELVDLPGLVRRRKAEKALFETPPQG